MLEYRRKAGESRENSLHWWVKLPLAYKCQSD
jgi:hypothetical protein